MLHATVTMNPVEVILHRVDYAIVKDLRKVTNFAQDY
jgi:hypothetical protein